MNHDSPEICFDSHRRAEIRARGHNGIDYVDVSDDRRSMTVYLLRHTPDDLTVQNVIVEGGPRSRKVAVTDLQYCSVEDAAEQDCFRITFNRPGDRSTYTLRLAEISDAGEPTDHPFHGFDPRYARLTFQFFEDVGVGMDCVSSPTCEPPPVDSVEINYLAKDFATFRQLVLDRLSLMMPDWTERHIADEMIALVEILAYTADHLSYYQDAVATEAYLSTARQRISVRRHVRLVDYPMHEGCNARAWVQIQLPNEVSSLAVDPATLLFMSGFDGRGSQNAVLTAAELAAVPADSYRAFQPVTSSLLPLWQAHNRILFYTWGNHECYLPKGATAATLQDSWKSTKQDHSPERSPGERSRCLALKPGDYLLLEEALGPATGVAPDADPAHRWVVRLTSVCETIDPLNELPLVEIEWDGADALPFALCLSTRGPAPHCERVKHVSIACGNIFLADQGTWIRNESLGIVPLALSAQTCKAEYRPSNIVISAGRFGPTLRNPNLAWRNSPVADVAAGSALLQDPRAALPQIQLISIDPNDDGSGPIVSFAEYERPMLLAVRLTQKPTSPATELVRERLRRKTLRLLRDFDPAKPLDEKLAAALEDEMRGFVKPWRPRIDLLNSAADARDFVVEMDDSRFAHLRFGDGMLGRRPQAGEAFFASYRIASESAGNVGRETVRHVAVLDEGLTSGSKAQSLAGLNIATRNPLAAVGGTDPEPVDEVKMYAPGAFLSQLDRAITAEDYAQLAERNPAVQRAAASLVWTGSRYEAQVVIDPLHTDAPDPALLQTIERYLYPFRRIGHDLSVVQANYVPLDLALSIQVKAGYLAAHVKRALLDALGNRLLASGAVGLFHSDNLTFGQSIYASQIIATAQSQDGVESVVITRLERLFDEEHESMTDGVLAIGPLEVAQLDNDAAHPERGRLRLQMGGGL